MLRVAMTKVCSAESFAVIINDHGAEDNFITPVHIHILNGKVMVAITIPGAAPAHVIAPIPELCQFMCRRVHIEGHKLMTRIASTAKEDAGPLSVEIRGAEVVLRGTVTAISIFTPNRQALRFTVFVAFQGISHGGECVLRAIPPIRFAGFTVQIEQELVAHTGIFVARGIIVHITDGDIVPCRCVDIHIVGATQQHFGLAIHIPVIGHRIPLLIRACHHVRSKVYPPKTRTIKFNDFNPMESRFIIGIIHATSVVTLAHKLHLTIAIHIGSHAVIKFVLVCANLIVPIYCRLAFNIEITRVRVVTHPIG